MSETTPMEVEITRKDKTVFEIRYGVWKSPRDEKMLTEEEKEIAIRIWKALKENGKDKDPKQLCQFVYKHNKQPYTVSKGSPVPA